MDSVADDGGRSFGFGGEGVGGFFGGAGGVGGGFGRWSGVLGVGTRDMPALRSMLAGKREGIYLGMMSLKRHTDRCTRESDWPERALHRL